MAAWEPWALFWLASLQFVAALWYHQGPSIRGTRGWVVWLFLLNGFATLLLGLSSLTRTSRIGAYADFFDVWTNLALFGVALALLQVRSRWAIVALPVALGVPLLAPIAVTLLGPKVVPLPAGLADLLRELPLLAAISLTALVLARSARIHDTPRLLMSSVLVMRFAEVTMSTFMVRFVNDRYHAPPIQLTADFARTLATISLVLALLYLVVARRKAAAEDRAFVDLSIGVVIAGVMVGAAQARSPVSATFLYFTIAFVRPLGFLALQSELGGLGLFGDDRWRRVRSMGAAFATGTIGLLIGASLWELTTPAATLLGGAIAIVAYVVDQVSCRSGSGRLAARDVAYELHPSSKSRTPAVSERLDQVSVPPRWLSALPYWERLAVVLYFIRESPANSYERSTPALARMTGVPAGSIGAETARTNHRFAYKAGPEAVGPVFASSWGSVRGLTSPRAKVYRLTAAGESRALDILGRLGHLVGSVEDARLLLLKSLQPQDVHRPPSGQSKRSDSDSALGESSRL